MESGDIRICPKCKETKSLSEFSIVKSGRRAGKPVSHCKVCRVAALKVAKKRDPSVYDRIERPSKLKRMYGISSGQYDAMLVAQNNKCAVCKSTDPGGRRYATGKTIMFSVDHCHATGKVRGLLCTHCNRALGLIKDNLDTALRMAEYLRLNTL